MISCLTLYVTSKIAWQAVGGGKIVHFSAKNFHATQRWAVSIHRALNAKAQAGNEIIYNEYYDQVDEKLRSLVGQEVVWDLTIESVDAQQVHVVHYFPPVFCISCVPGAKMRGEVLMGDAVLELDGGIITIGRQMTLEEARNLSRGDTLRICGTISQARLYPHTGELGDVQQMVVIELSKVMSAAFSAKQRDAALAAEAQPQPKRAISAEEYMDRVSRLR